MIERAHEKGFTLTELLLAVLILGLMMSLLAGGMRFGTSVWGRGAAEARAMSDITPGTDFVQRLLARIYPLEAEGARAGEIWIEGSGDEVSFVGRFPQPWSDGSLYWLRFTRDVVAYGDERLLLSWCRVSYPVAERQCGEEREQEVILKNVRDVSFSYFDGGETRAWVSSWSSGRGMPSLIQVSLTPLQSERAAPVVLAVRPRIDSDALCQFDPVSRRCRRRI